MNSFLYFEVREMKNLRAAWNKIYSNGTSIGASKKSKEDVLEFKREEGRNLKRIQNKLLKGNFKFAPAKAVPIKKSNGAMRPLVSASVETKIIQRCILDVLQKQDFIKKYLTLPTSFGSIKNKGVPQAIEATIVAIHKGASYYIASDIKSFFTQVPLPKVYEMISSQLQEEDRVDFMELLKGATKLEIDNLENIKKADRKYFEFDETGTPQGCCLSPLLSNILLYEFDIQMNDDKTKCMRYLDDFVILSADKKSAWEAFDKAKKLLKKYDLSVYSPKKEEDKDKCGEGLTTNAFEFLGVEIKGTQTSPSHKNRNKISEEISGILKQGAQNLAANKFDSKESYDHSLVSTISYVSRKIQGWGNQYFFCTDRSIFKKLDRTIDKKIEEYLHSYSAAKRRFETFQDFSKNHRRLLGVHLLEDCKYVPTKLEEKS
jgi:RNA-directed DNA polymerase